MNISWRISAVFLLLVSMIGLCPGNAGAQAQTALTTISGPQGGKIVYGTVNGAATQAVAMARMLNTVHSNCGEKPQIGRVFQFTGTNLMGVFFTVIDHPDGNIPLAGMVIANSTGSNQLQAAMLYDQASRFGQSVNPMLQQLYGVWHIGETPQAGGGTSVAGGTPGASPSSASAPAGASVPLPPMHLVTLPDGTASAQMPDGWQVQPGGHLGTIGFLGPHQEFVVLNAVMSAQDPTTPNGYYQNTMRYGIRPQPGTVVQPYNTDWVKAFPNVYLAFAQVLKLNPTDFKMDNTQLLPATGGQKPCVQGTGHVNNGSGLMELTAMYCPEPPEQPQSGLYFLFEFVSLVPAAYADQERATVAAVFGSYRWDEAKAKSLAAAQAAPMIAQMQKTYQAHQQALMSFTQSQIDRTKQIGANATARYNATQQANDAQHAAFNQHEDGISRQGQGFSNYLLDQTVIQDNTTGGHATTWNSFADALVKSNPKRWQYVDTPDYIKGTDY